LIFAMLAAPFAVFAREGVPTYYSGYSSAYGNNYSYGQQRQQYTNNQYQPQQNAQGRYVVGQRSYSYQVPSQGQNGYQNINGTMTPNGIAIPRAATDTNTSIALEYGRKFADFQFETGVQSVLEWDDMLVNEFGIHIERDFSLRIMDLFLIGDYRYGKMSDGGLSMDYDLRPYDDSMPDYGIFTISIGEQSGTMQNIKVGVGARHIWDLSGWKLSPMIGYQVFKHDLQMANHIYPNPGVYIPLLTQDGRYVYGDGSGNYYAPQPNELPPDGWSQVCLSPEDLALAAVDGYTGQPYTDAYGVLQTTNYDPLYEWLPWGVGAGECVIVGGDGMVMVSGTTHIYNTAWSGIYLGLEIEKQMTYTDKLRFYAEVSLPHYKSEGTWPNRTDWQQSPSFIDEGDTGGLHYQAEMEYIYQFSPRVQLSIKADASYWHIGKIPGELYVAGYAYYVDADGDGYADFDETTGFPIVEWQEPYTEFISDSLKEATYRSFGAYLGVKYAF